MKISCCNNCIVDPMCASGCDALWDCHVELKKKKSKCDKASTISIRAMIVISIFWGIGNLTGYINVNQDSNMVTIDHLGMVFWYWWYLIGYATIVSIFLLFELLSKIIKRTINTIEGNERGFFIWHKKMQQEGIKP